MLQKIALAEARGEGVAGMAYVMQVVLNRVEHEDFPSTIEEVIKENDQFSSYANGSYELSIPNEKSMEALALLEHLVNHGQLYFENAYGEEDTWHSRNLKYVFEYKDHIFYK